MRIDNEEEIDNSSLYSYTRKSYLEHAYYLRYCMELLYSGQPEVRRRGDHPSVSRRVRLRLQGRSPLDCLFV